MTKKNNFIKYKIDFRSVAFLFFFPFQILAQKDLPNPPSDFQSIPAGSFVIPMDTIYQSIVPLGQAPFNLKAYGLINQFLQNGIPVKWAIRSAKQKDDIDFTATAERYAPGFLAASSIDFRAGPFIVVDTTLPCGISTNQIINSFANNVAVYKLTTNVIVDVRYTLTHRPKIAVISNGGHQLTHTKILDAAGISDYTIKYLDPTIDILTCYTFASIADLDNWGDLGPNPMTALQLFVGFGGNFLAQCRAIADCENHPQPAPPPPLNYFHTTLGVDSVNTTVSHFYPNADLAFSQIHGPLQANEPGHLRNWTLRNGSAWEPLFYKSVAYTGDTLIAAGAHLLASSANGGNVFYLGGHDYSSGNNGTPSVPDLTVLARVNGLRLYLNAVFIPPGNTAPWVKAGGPSITICPNDSVTLGCSPTGPPGFNYLWTPSAGLSCTTCPNPLANPSNTQTYTVKASLYGCTAIDTVKVIIQPFAAAAFSNTIVCEGEEVSFINQSTNSNSWTWDFGDPASGNNNFSTDQNPTHTFSSGGNFVIFLTASNAPGCADTTYSTSLFFNPLPVITVSSDTVCAGQAATLTANGASSYLWSTGSITDTIIVTPVSPASYTVTGTSALGCTQTGVGSVAVNLVPNVTVNSDTICLGQSATLTANGANSYSWSTGAIVDSIFVNPTSTNSYTVTGTSSGCTQSAIGIITVNYFPLITVNSDTICEGETATLTAVGASSYSWSNGATIDSITVAPTSTTTYTVTGNPSSCPQTASGTVTVNFLPVVTISDDTILCKGDSTILTASGGTNYLWNNGSTSPMITVSPIATEAFTVTVSNGFCSSTAYDTVFISPVPIATATEEEICAGQMATLTAAGGETYLWNNGNENASITVSPTITSTYSVIASIGSCADTASAIVTVNPLPVVALGNDQTICEGQSVTLDAGNTGASYLWSTSETSQTVSVSEAGIYWVIITLNNCLAKDTISTFDAPKVELHDASLCTTAPILLDAGNGASSYLWSTGSTSQSILVDEAGSYSVVAIFGSCTSSDTAKISGDGTGGELFVPNTFTPNNDGINDIFLAKVTGIESFNMNIFDRWGNLIFTSDDLDIGWDGKVEGKHYILQGNDGKEVSQQEVYIWRIYYTTECFPKLVRESLGTITIIK